MRGFVYVLSNPALPGLYKVGFTTRTVKERLCELSTSTSVPIEFKLELFIEVDRARELEGDAHDALDEHHYGKEYFRCDLIRLVQVVKTCVGSGGYEVFGKGGPADELTYSDAEVFARETNLEHELADAHRMYDLADEVKDFTSSWRQLMRLIRLEPELTEARYESYRRRWAIRMKKEAADAEREAAAEERRLIVADQRRALEYKRLMEKPLKPEYIIEKPRCHDAQVSISRAFAGS